MLDRRRFLTDWFANLLSFACFGISGLLINSMIAKFYGAAALGIFNQVFAIYILGSQLATVGVQFSVLRYIAEFYQDTAVSARILAAALVVVGLAGIVVALGFNVIFHLAGGLLYSEEVNAGIFYMLPGLWAFAVNKVFLNALNGAHRNRSYAAFTALRYLLLMLSAALLTVLQVEPSRLGIMFSASELLLMLALAVQCRIVFPGCFSSDGSEWIVRHLRFGVRSILGGVAVEMNTRVDVLILGIFTSDAAVGIYSFAAFFVEGLLQLPLAARRIIDPVLTQLVIEGDTVQLREFLRKGRDLGALLIIAVAAGAVLLYPLYATLLADRPMAQASWTVFAILMAGACVFGAYATFSGIFSQSGLPMAQTHFNLVILVVNSALNLVLAPLYGVHGAAVATSLSFIAGTLFFRRRVRHHLAVRF
jgi:O-antigen/teichoic acid export membrane protein